MDAFTDPKVRISIHAPREGSDPSAALLGLGLHISIHAPREGSDGSRAVGFQCLAISIHAPREGSDPPSASTGCCPSDFNPRSP